MQGHRLHGSLHAFIPMSFLFVVLSFGSFAWHNKLLRFCGCLNASIGGLLKVLSRLGSFVIVLQCFLIMFDTLGNLGFYVSARTTLSFCFFSLLKRVVFLSMSQALSRAAFTTFLLYFLDNSIVFSSFNLCFRISLVLQIRTRRSANE